MRQGAIHTSQAVQDPVQCLMSRGCFFRESPADFNLWELPKSQEKNPSREHCPRFSLFGRPDLEPPSILPSLIALVFTGIGTNTLSSYLGFTLTSSKAARVCHYMMQPRGKIQSPRVLHSQWPIHTNGNCAVPSRPAVTLYKALALPLRPMISPPHDICETPQSSSHTFKPSDSLHSHSHQTLCVSIDPKINHKSTAWSGTLFLHSS